MSLHDPSITGRLANVESRIQKAAGLREFGENYIQEFAEKRLALDDLAGAKYHFIGHLQSNKARLACQLFDIVQTADSARLLAAWMRRPRSSGPISK